MENKDEYEVNHTAWIVKNNLIQNVRIVKKQVIETFDIEDERKNTREVLYYVSGVATEDRRFIAAMTQVKHSDMYPTKESAILNRSCEPLNPPVEVKSKGTKK